LVNFTSSLDGLQRADVRFESAAKRIAQQPTDTNADLPTDTVNLLDAKNSYDANLKAVQVGDEMMKSTLNILA
jgi:flagellar basal body rod protein FlgG